MLRFFRKMRSALIPENRFGRYFFYALGEIVLVVIGILIALQVNNWNEISKNRKNEIEILKDIKEEISENQMTIEKAMLDYIRNRDRCKKLSGIVGPNALPIEITQLDTLVNALIYPPRYNPSEGVINAVISSGDLAIIKNKEIKYKISSLSGLLKTYNFWAEVSYDNMSERHAPFLQKHYPFKNILPLEFGRSKFEVNQLALLRNFEFESLVQLRYLNSNSLNNYLMDIKHHQNLLLELIEKELKKQ